MRRFVALSVAVSVFSVLVVAEEASCTEYGVAVSLTGSGVGSVNSSPAALSCTYPPQGGTCSATLAAGTPLSLIATPGAGSLFAGWSGSCLSCSEAACPVTVTGARHCIATFTIPPPIALQGIAPVYYTLLQDAFNAVPDRGTVLVREVPLPETVTMKRPVALFVRGGFDPSFASQGGRSVVNGKLLLRAGKVVPERVTIAAPDRQAPSAPAQLAAVAVGPREIDLSWHPSTDGIGVAGYQIFRAGAFLGNSRGTSYADTAVGASTGYCYTVRAFDSSGNLSAKSVQACATTPDSTPGAPVQVPLDADGIVQTTITATGPGGSELTLYAGTRISLTADGGGVQPPAAGTVALSLTTPSEALPSLPTGISALLQLRIALTVDGTERDAFFWPGTNPTGGGEGAKLVAAVSGSSLDSGTLGILYQALSGQSLQVGTSPFKATGGSALLAAATSAHAAAATSSSGQMQFAPNRTGAYNVGGSAAGSGSAPGGAFWSSFLVSDPGCVPVDNVNVCGPVQVDRVEIIEESTAEILGMCWFGDSNTAATGPVPSGYQFWCERIPGASGGSEIKVSSMQANLPLLHSYLVRASDGLPMWETYVQASGGLHGADGGVYSDPYGHTDFEFAGFKKLTFTTTADKDYSWMREHALQPLEGAGYHAYLKSFQSNSPGFTAEIGVYDTLDGRALMQENTIEKIWKVRTGEETKGNRGTYEYKGKKYKGTAKAVMELPMIGAKVWEVSADVTFELDAAASSKEMDVYNSTEGSVTQTIYTFPSPYGGCAGSPASFTDTYTVLKEDGQLFFQTGSDPLQYTGSASLSSSSPIKTRSYTVCCPYSGCTEETLEVDAQEHPWLMTATGGAFTPAQAGGILQGSYSMPPFGPRFEWNFAPVEENQ